MSSGQEYLPSESETPLPVEVTQGNAQIDKPLIRMQCASCYAEKGMPGTWEDAASLLEYLGWRIGREILCPTCAKERAREFIRKHQ